MYSHEQLSNHHFAESKIAAPNAFRSWQHCYSTCLKSLESSRIVCTLIRTRSLNSLSLHPCGPMRKCKTQNIFVHWVDRPHRGKVTPALNDRKICFNVSKGVQRIYRSRSPCTNIFGSGSKSRYQGAHLNDFLKEGGCFHP